MSEIIHYGRGLESEPALSAYYFAHQNIFGGLPGSRRIAELSHCPLDVYGVEDIEGAIAAVVLLDSIGGDLPEIFALATREDRRRHGLASQLLEFAEGTALRAGSTELYVSPSWLARGFYEKRGYELVEGREPWRRKNLIS